MTLARDGEVPTRTTYHGRCNICARQGHLGTGSENE
jgi:hypothetical protein